MADDLTRPHRDERAADDLGRFVQRVMVVALIVVLLLLAWSWRHVLFLAFASVLIACGLRGLADPLARRLSLPEGVALAAAALIVLSVLGGVMYLFGAQIAGEFETLRQTIPDAFASLQQRLSQSEVGRFVLEQIDGLRQTAQQSNWLPRVGSFSVAFFNGALEAFLVIVAAIFFAVSPRLYREGVLLLVPRATRPSARAALNGSGAALKKWLLGTLASMTAITLSIWVGLALLGVPAPLALGLLAGIAQFVPVIGPIIAAFPGVMLALASDPTTALWVALLYFIASQLEANVLYPIIQSYAVSQPPVLTIFSIVAFGLLFGPLGVLLAVPVTVVVMVFITKFYLQDTLGEDVALPGEHRKRATISADA